MGPDPISGVVSAARRYCKKITRDHRMPRIQRNRNTVIELSIPLNLSRGGAGSGSDDEDDACFICAHTFCSEDVCLRRSTHLSCCSQTICCGCTVKLAKRCKCTDDCEAIIAFCPFCREMVPVSTLELFSGIQLVCKLCAPPTTPMAPTPQPSGSRVPAPIEERPGEAATVTPHDLHQS